MTNDGTLTAQFLTYLVPVINLRNSRLTLKTAQTAQFFYSLAVTTVTM